MLQCLCLDSQTLQTLSFSSLHPEMAVHHFLWAQVFLLPKPPKKQDHKVQPLHLPEEDAESWVMVAHAFNPSTQEAEADGAP